MTNATCVHIIQAFTNREQLAIVNTRIGLLEGKGLLFLTSVGFWCDSDIANSQFYFSA